MNKRIALLFSGQGAQTVGMGYDLSQKYPVVADLFSRADSILGRQFSDLVFHGPVEELTLTKNCQPALFVHGLACLAALRQEIGDFPITAAAGLSLGEFTAHAAAGTFDFESGLRLVEKRGLFMQEACEQTLGSMAAMIGGDEETVRTLATETDVDIANLNCPGQIVISGETASVTRAVSFAKERGIRLAKVLNVAGAYHSRLMNSAFVRLGKELAMMELKTPRFPVVCNTDAIPVTSAEEIRESLEDQVTGTVRWSDSIEYLIDRERCDLYIELGPGAVLAGLLQRTRKGTPCLSISDCDTLMSAVEALRA